MPISPPKNNIALQNTKKNELINCGIYLIVHGLYFAQIPIIYHRYFSLLCRHVVKQVSGKTADLNVSCYTLLDNKKPAKPYDLRVFVLY
jgi:hypothetical protein